jgi:hypothetical protein
VKWAKVKAGIYEQGKYTLRKHDGLTWQDRPYWLVYVNGENVRAYNGRPRRFRTLVDAKAFVQEKEEKK